jgi:steroid delta-isomerase-like uncharacterized protein
MEDNKTVARLWFEEVWNGRSTEAIDRRMSPQCIVHGLGDGGHDLRGPAEFKPFHAAFTNAFSDLNMTIEDMIEEGDRVAVRWTVRGTHTGDSLGLPATKRTVAVSGMTIARIQNGKLVEGWNNFDVMGMMQQLGAAPPPARRW